ncbi:MAG: methyltransferase domain-containing protein [Candidatus Limnocylindrales bacterium]
MRRQAGAIELLDGPLEKLALAGNLRDLARVNRLLGGAGLSWRALEPIIRRYGWGTPLRFLDVGTGAADIPRYLRRSSAYRYPLTVVAADVRPEIVEVARRATSRTPDLVVRLGSPDGIDEADGSFDVVHASLVIHHLEPPEAVRMLREMARVASRAVIINDLERAKRWLIAATLLACLTTRNSYTRHDAPLSVRRAYRPNELRQLAERAGLVEEARYWARPRYRYAITFRHSTARA